MFRNLLSKVFRRRIRTPLFPQLDVTECGAACLGAILGFYGRWVSIEELRTACGVSRDGSSATDIVNAGKQYGLKITGWRRSISGLRDISLPAILFWEFNHFVVLEHIRGSRYYINDPANGRRTVGEEIFNRSYTGVALAVEPTDDFRPGGTSPGVVQNIWPWLRGVKAPLAYAAICGMLLALPALALPIILSSFVDSTLAGNLSVYRVHLDNRFQHRGWSDLSSHAVAPDRPQTHLDPRIRNPLRTPTDEDVPSSLAVPRTPLRG